MRKYIGAGEKGRKAAAADATRREGLEKLRAIARGEAPVGDTAALLIVEEQLRWAAARQVSAAEAMATGGVAGEPMGVFEALAMAKLLELTENVRRGLLGRPRLEDAPATGPTRLLVTYRENGEIKPLPGPPAPAPMDEVAPDGPPLVEDDVPCGLQIDASEDKPAPTDEDEIEAAIQALIAEDRGDFAEGGSK